MNDGHSGIFGQVNATLKMRGPGIPRVGAFMGKRNMANMASPKRAEFENVNMGCNNMHKRYFPVAAEYTELNYE